MRRLFQTFALGLAAAAIITVFSQFGGFTLSASILLGGCFTVVGVWIHGIYKVAAFRPYSLQYFINFEALREDFGMTESQDSNGDAEHAYQLYNFTAIRQGLFTYYREHISQTANKLKLSGRNTRTDDEYRSAIVFGDTIPGILKFRTEWGDPNTNIFWFPRFIFRHGWDGFELRVQVVSEWWSAYKQQLSHEMRNRPVDSDGFIVLAVLPYGYIPDHVRRWDERSSLFYPFDKIDQRWKARLAELGWTVGERHVELSSRHLIVRYQSIWPA